jgi:hypothetical protein
VLAAALTAFAAGCSGSSASDGSRKQGAGQAFPSNPAEVSGAPGQLTIQASGTDLQVTGAELKPGPNGTSLLSATIKNSGAIPEHLAAVTGTNGEHATISQGGAKAGSVSTAGVLLSPGSTTSIGGSGRPVVQLPQPVASGPTEKLMVEFAVAGLVHMQVRAAH